MTLEMTESSQPPATWGVDRVLEPRVRKLQDEHTRLVEAAREVMTRRRTVEPTVAEVLAVAKLSTNTFYRHFPTKDDLLLELVMEAGANTRSYVSHRMADVEAPADRIATWIQAMFDLLGTTATLEANRPFLLAHPRLVERFPDEIVANATLLIEPLAAAIVELRPDRKAEATDEAWLIYHQVFGILLDRAAMTQTRDMAEVTRVVDYSLRALTGHAPAKDLPQGGRRRRGPEPRRRR
jgi:AcrR family transcriptional regulator